MPLAQIPWLLKRVSRRLPTTAPTAPKQPAPQRIQKPKTDAVFDLSVTPDTPAPRTRKKVPKETGGKQNIALGEADVNTHVPDKPGQAADSSEKGSIMADEGVNLSAEVPLGIVPTDKDSIMS